MKKCCTCGVEQPTSNFNIKRASKDGLERYCKPCHKARNKRHYDNNKQVYIAQARKSGKAYYAWYKDIKKDLSCERCGESHPATIEFHHLDPSQKDGSISEMAVARKAKQAILDEIAKCIVLCSNCHRKEHYDNASVKH